LSFSSPQSDVRDLEVLRRCRQGDVRAFAELVDRYKNGVFRLMFQWVRQKEIAEELAQDVFLKAHRDLGNFRGDAKFSTWLYQIALNRCRDHWRSRKRRPEVPVEAPILATEPAKSPASDAELQAKEEGARLRRALDSLPEIYREALTLRYFSDLSHEEIAAISGEGLSNVKMRVARGLAQLRKKLEGC